MADRDAGDQRVYTDGIGEIYFDGVIVLKVNNCRLTVKTPYPTKEQCDQILKSFNPLYNSNFANDIGTGQAVTGNGWGTIVEGESDGDWINALDPNGTGQVKYSLSSITSIIQQYYGFFNFDITVEPTTFQEIIEARNILDLKTTDVEFINTGISTSFTNPSFFDDTLRYVYTNKIKTNPGGANPDGINNIYGGYYWQIGTNFTSYSEVDVVFNISDIPGIGNYSDLRILRRSVNGSNWEILNTTIPAKGTELKTSGLTSLGEFAIGSVGSNNPLPVELTSFEAEVVNNDVSLKWVTATELNNYGFEIERKKGNEDWIKIGFIEGSGNSNCIKNYTYIDNKLQYGKYLYRLKQIDTDGKFKYSNQIETTILNLSFNVNQNYPNPFNPATTISFSLPNKELVTLKIYDSLGKEIATLVNEELNQGIYEKSWDASLFGSGVYYYRLTAGGFSKTCKMLLVK
ncbi:MAG TPA: T9SS type A sorting domain-containing protein [Melioribacteraceae bacterium]|nr:T9SS type A sorting domain-containing protein [Melioribacteraceae bacterium]